MDPFFIAMGAQPPPTQPTSELLRGTNRPNLRGLASSELMVQDEEEEAGESIAASTIAVVSTSTYATSPATITNMEGERTTANARVGHSSISNGGAILPFVAATMKAPDVAESIEDGCGDNGCLDSYDDCGEDDDCKSIGSSRSGSINTISEIIEFYTSTSSFSSSSSSCDGDYDDEDNHEGSTTAYSHSANTKPRMPLEMFAGTNSREGGKGKKMKKKISFCSTIDGGYGTAATASTSNRSFSSLPSSSSLIECSGGKQQQLRSGKRRKALSIVDRANLATQLLLSKLQQQQRKRGDERHNNRYNHQRTGKMLLSYDQLMKIEQRRRDILKRSELPLYKLLLCYDGTVLQTLFQEVWIYVTLFTYIIVRVLVRNCYYVESVSSSCALLHHVFQLIDGGDNDDENASSFFDNIDILGNALSFLLFFYVYASYQRFETQYKASMVCEGRIFDICSILRGYSPTMIPKDTVVRINRYLNAMHIAGYVGLASASYSFENFFQELNSFMKVLTPSEVERIDALDMDSGGTVYREIMTWCIHEINKLQYPQPLLLQQPKQRQPMTFCGKDDVEDPAAPLPQTPPTSSRHHQQGCYAPPFTKVNERVTTAASTATSTSQDETLQPQRGTTGTAAAPRNFAPSVACSTGIDSHVANQLRELVIELRRSVATIYDVHDQPVSFFVVHFICLLSSIYLPSSAIKIGMMNVRSTTNATSSSSDSLSNITTTTSINYDYQIDDGDGSSNTTGIDNYYTYYFLLNDILSGLLVFIQCVFILGLRLLANQMEKPYSGCDVKDLSVIHYINFTWIMSCRMLESEMPTRETNNEE